MLTTSNLQPIKPTISTYPMLTRSKLGIYKTKTYLASLLKSPTTPVYTSSIPKTFSQSLSSPQWKQAMAEDYTALVNNNTWELVPQQSNTNIVANKWIFRIK